MDMNFIFEWSTRYLTRSLRSLMRYRVDHSKIKFICTHGHVISSTSFCSISFAFPSPSKLHISGQGSLSITGNDVKISVDKIFGDNSGILTVRPSQIINMVGSEGHLPFSLLSQKGSNVTFYKSMNCRFVEVVLRGIMGSMKNLTVGPQCRFFLENSTETEFTLNHAVVQTGGYMAILREDRKDVQINGKTFDIRGGAMVSGKFSFSL